MHLPLSLTVILLAFAVVIANVVAILASLLEVGTFGRCQLAGIVG